MEHAGPFWTERVKTVLDGTNYYIIIIIIIIIDPLPSRLLSLRSVEESGSDKIFTTLVGGLLPDGLVIGGSTVQVMRKCGAVNRPPQNE